MSHDRDDLHPLPPATPPRDLGPMARAAADSAPGDLDSPPPAWRQALEAAIANDPTGRKGVAERLGVSRPYVSRITTGHIPEASPLFIQRVVDTLMQVECPHLQKLLPPGQCRTYASRSYEQISAFEVSHWRACRRCPNNALRARIGSERPAAPPQQRGRWQDATPLQQQQGEAA